MDGTITVDAIRAAELPEAHYYATSDQGGNFGVIAYTAAGVIVRSTRTGAYARIVRIGKAARDGLVLIQVRVRIEFARDIGDALGTLAFDEHDPDHMGIGVAPLAAFQAQERS